MSTRRTAKVTLLALLLLTVASHSLAQGVGQKPDKFRVFVGGFFARLETDTRITSNDLGGTTVSLEDDLGLDDDEVVLFGGFRWRFGKRHSLGVTHVGLDRDADQILSRDLQIGDNLFTVSAETMTEFDFSFTTLSYQLSFWAHDRFDLGLMVGVSNVSFDFEVVGDVNTPVGGATARVAEGEDYPVPSVGLGFRYKFTDDWLVRGGATYFEYEIDDEWFASMFLAGVGVEWFPWRHFGFGVEYDFVSFEYDEDDSNSDQFDVDFEYSGIRLNAIGRF